jgi:hypothetical protein
MAESYFGIHLCKLTTFSGTVGGELRQVLLYIIKENLLEYIGIELFI